MQVKLVSDMLLPVLESFAGQPHLVDSAIRVPGSAAVTGSGGSFSSASSTPPASNSSLSSAAGAAGNGSNGSLAAVTEPRGVAPAVAAGAATLQLRVLEVFFFLPGAGLWSKCHGVLINLCTMQISGVAGSRVSPEAAAAVAGSSLRHMMNNQDAVLGPWLPSRDVLEDELRHFTGECWGRGPGSMGLGTLSSDLVVLNAAVYVVLFMHCRAHIVPLFIGLVAQASSTGKHYSLLEYMTVRRGVSVFNCHDLASVLNSHVLDPLSARVSVLPFIVMRPASLCCCLLS